MQQEETVAHESTHHGLNTGDGPVQFEGDRHHLYPVYGDKIISRMVDAGVGPDQMMNYADPVTLSLGFQRDDGY